MVESANWFTMPGSLNHQTYVAMLAITSSTYIPAAPINARCHLLGSIQESLTLQYKQGVSTRNITPISWHSPPKCLHDMPWPNSCRILVAVSVIARASQFCAEKNELNDGSRDWKTSNWTITSVRAAVANMSAAVVASGVKNHRT